MEHGTVEWNSRMVDRWNGGMEEWATMTNDPLPYLLICMFALQYYTGIQIRRERRIGSVMVGLEHAKQV